MILIIDSDASYLSEPKAGSLSGGHIYLSNATKNLTKPPDASHNGAIHTLSNIIHNLVSSATEVGFDVVFLNGKDGAMLRMTLHDTGHPQPATLI
jgi:hypothetical protein